MIFSFNIDGNIDNQTQRVILDNKSYEFKFQWNYKMETWGVYISDVGSEPYCYFTLTIHNMLTDSYKYDERLPKGTFYAGNYLESGTRIGRYNVGPSKECFFIYLSEE